MSAVLHSLIKEHRAIEAGADALLAGLRQLPRIRMEELGRLRTEHSALLRAHLLAEEEHVHRRIAELPAEHRPADTDAIARTTRELHSRYSEHIRRWHSRSIDIDFTGYARDTTVLIRMLKTLIIREEAELYRTLLALADRVSA